MKRAHLPSIVVQCPLEALNTLQEGCRGTHNSSTGCMVGLWLWWQAQCCLVWLHFNNHWLQVLAQGCQLCRCPKLTAAQKETARTAHGLAWWQEGAMHATHNHRCSSMNPFVQGGCKPCVHSAQACAWARRGARQGESSEDWSRGRVSAKSLWSSSTHRASMHPQSSPPWRMCVPVMPIRPTSLARRMSTRCRMSQTFWKQEPEVASVRILC